MAPARGLKSKPVARLSPPGWRRGWWGWPVAAGNGSGAWAYDDYPYYADPYIIRNGYAWINICY